MRRKLHDRSKRFILYNIKRQNYLRMYHISNFRNTVAGNSCLKNPG